MKRRWLGVVLLLSAVGCDRGLGPDALNRQPTPARLHLNISYSDQPEQVNVLAWLDLGVDELGRPRSLPHDSLIVLGVPIGTTARTGPQLPYMGTIPLTAEEFASTPLSIKPPTLSGLVPRYQMDTWSTVGRIGQRTLTARRGADIVLPVAHPDESSLSVLDEQVWFLSAYSGADQLVQFRGKDKLPREFILPGSFLTRGQSNITAILYTMAHRSDGALTEGDYLITPVVDTRLSWVIVLSN